MQTVSNNRFLAWLKRDGFWLLLLFLLVGGLRAWGVTHTAVAARDSIGFTRYARQFEHEPWVDVLRNNLHPPLYPLTVLAVSLPMRHVLTSPEALMWQYSAQIASSLAGMLLVVPMYYLGRKLFDRRVGFGAALLFQCLPISAHALSDGLTEGVFFLLTAFFLLVSLSAVRRQSAWRFALCGLLSGLAYLARPEGAALALMLGLLLVLLQLRKASRWPVPRMINCAVALTITALVVGGPYMLIIHGFTNKNSVKWLMEHRDGGYYQSKAASLPAEDALAFAEPRQDTESDATPSLLHFTNYAPDWRTAGKHSSNLKWGVEAFFVVLCKGFHFIVWLPALLGLWWFRRRIWEVPGALVGGLLCLLYVPLLLRLGVVAGYISDRHSLIFVLCGSFWAVAAMLELPRRLAGERRAESGESRAGNVRVFWLSTLRSPLFAYLCFVALILWCLPSTLRTLHPTRAGFRAAGFWLAAQAKDSEDICDPFCWSEFYAGRAFTPSWDLHIHDDSWKHGGYVVLDHVYSSNHHSHLPELEKAKRLAAESGTIVYRWPANASTEKAMVLVYSVPAR